jgi:hypothetical protein
MASSPSRSPQPRPSLVWPVILIGIGGIFLLNNLGVLDGNVWVPLLRLWPLLLILIGIEILVGRRTPAASAFGAILLIVIVGGLVATLVFFPDNPTVQSLSSPVQELHQERIQSELGSTETADVQITWNPGTGSLTSLGVESTDIIQGTVTYLDTLNASIETRNTHADITLAADEDSRFGFDFLNVDWRASQWELGLHPSVTYDLELDAPSGEYAFHLAELRLASLKLDTGSGRVALELPAGAYPVEIDAGSGSLEITIPRVQAVRLEVGDGSGPLNLSSQFTLVDGAADGNGSWETAGYAQTGGLLIELDMGSGDVNITR